MSFLSLPRMNRDSRMKYLCDICANSFKTNNRLRNHIEKHKVNRSKKIMKNVKSKKKQFKAQVVFGIMIQALPKGFRPLDEDDITYDDDDDEFNLRLLSDVICNLKK